MMVRPELSSARRAPSTSPLKVCDRKFGQESTRNLALEWASRSGIAAHLASKGVRRLHQSLAGNDFDDIVIVVGALHIRLLLSALDDDRSNQLVVGAAEIHPADSGYDFGARLVGLDDVERPERLRPTDGIRPRRDLHVRPIGAPLRNAVVFGAESVV